MSVALVKLPLPSSITILPGGMVLTISSAWSWTSSISFLAGWYVLLAANLSKRTRPIASQRRSWGSDFEGESKPSSILCLKSEGRARRMSSTGGYIGVDKAGMEACM